MVKQVRLLCHRTLKRIRHLLSTAGGGTNSESSSFGSSTGDCFTFFSFLGFALAVRASRPGMSGFKTENGAAAADSVTAGPTRA